MEKINFRDDFVREQLAHKKLNEALAHAVEEKMAIAALNEMVQVDRALSDERRNDGLRTSEDLKNAVDDEA